MIKLYYYLKYKISAVIYCKNEMKRIQFFTGKKIIYKNPGYFKLEDGCFFYTKEYSQGKYTLEEMENFYIDMNNYIPTLLDK